MLIQLLQWTWERLEVESARGHQEKAPNIRGLTYNIQVICTHGCGSTIRCADDISDPQCCERAHTPCFPRNRWAGDAIPQGLRPAIGGKGVSLGQSPFADILVTAAVFEGRICLDENKKPVYNPDAKIGKVLQDGEEVARLEDWIGEASEVRDIYIIANASGLGAGGSRAPDGADLGGRSFRE